MAEEVKGELAALCDELKTRVQSELFHGSGSDMQIVSLTAKDLLRVLAAARRAEEAEREFAKLKARQFPVLQPPPGCPSRVPWSFVAPHEGQALRNHDQTLERLAQRGGLGAEELVAVVRGERWRERTFKTEEDAAVELARMLSPLDENARAAAFLRTHGETLAFGLALTTGSDAETVSEERRQKALAAVKALGGLKLDGTKPCPECTGRFACERCGVEVRQSYQPGTCDGTDDCEPRFMNEHDVMGTFRDVNGCDRCHHSGRVPNDEAGR